MLKHPAFRFVFCATLLCFSLQAASVIVGAPAQSGTGNCDPFGCPAFFGLGTYQQVYDSSAFPTGPIDIQALTFFDIQVQNSGQPADGVFTFSLSYTSYLAGALNVVNPNYNVATGFETIYSGTLPSLTNIPTGGKEMTVGGGSFVYDPSIGNLLLTISVANPTDKSTWAYFDQSANMNQTSNAYFGTYNGKAISGGNTIGGLVTMFSYSGVTPPPQVPEPATTFLVLAGAGLIGFMRFSRRRA